MGGGWERLGRIEGLDEIECDEKSREKLQRKRWEKLRCNLKGKLRRSEKGWNEGTNYEIGELEKNVRRKLSKGKKGGMKEKSARCHEVA